MAAHMRAAGVGGIRRETYAAASAVTRREMSRATRFARADRMRRHSRQSSPNWRPAVKVPQRAQGTSANPVGNRIAELAGGRGAAQVPGADSVVHDGGADRGA